MSQENLALVRRLVGAWNRDADDAVLALIHPAIEWRTSGVFPGLDPIYRGHEGVREFRDSLKSAWERFTTEVEQVLDEGDTVVGIVRLKAVGRTSGIEADVSFANVWRFEAGLLVSYTAYSSIDEALASRPEPA